MHFAMRMALAVTALALVAMVGVNAQKAGDWAGGWNTWEAAEKGDWVEYSMESGNKVRYEITGAGDGKVSYKHIIFNDKGEQASEKELKDRDWKRAPLQARMPQGGTVANWTTAELTMGEVKLACDVASWTISGTSTTVYFSKSIPCGGIVKVQTNNKDIVWLSSFFSKELGAAKSDKTPQKVQSKLPKFFASEGNFMVLKVTSGSNPESFQRREITSVAEEASKWSVMICEADGTPKGGVQPREFEQTKADWDAKYATPREKGKKIKVGEVELECNVYETVAGKRTTTEWVHEGAIVKTVVKDGDKETVLQAIMIEIK